MAIETNELIDVKTLSPFRRFIMTIGNLPTSYLESMTYGEMLMWFCNYLQETVIPTVNNNAEAVEELQGLYVELKDYVDNYFDNLDVQSEINNKLDELVRDGTMTSLIQNIVTTEIQPQIDQQNQEISSFEDGIDRQIEVINNKVESATSGSPKGVYSTVSDLETADPDHDYIYVVTADGKWYYWNGTAWDDGGLYQSDSIDLKAISPEKTTFLEPMNLAKLTLNTYSGYQLGGVTYVNADLKYTDKIPIESETTYRMDHIRFIDYYDENKDFLSSVNNSSYTKNITTPANAKYMVVSYHISYSFYIYPLQYYYVMVEHTNINYDYVEKNNTDINIIYDNLGHYNGYVKYLNNISGYYLTNNGSLGSNADLYTTPLLKCDAGSHLKISNCRFLEFYDDNLNVLEFTDNHYATVTVTVPTDSKYFKFTNKLDTLSQDFVYCTEDIEIYESASTNSNNNKVNSIPPKIEIDLNESLIIYLNDALPFDEYLIDYTYSGNDNHVLYKPSDNTITLLSDTAENANLTIKIYNKQLDLLDTKVCNVIFKDVTLANKTALFIGDSTIAQNKITQNLLDIYSADSKTLTLLGTLGTGSNKFEGYAGATLHQLVTSPTLTSESLTNPFYNSGSFDFSYYMNNQNYASVDEVFIEFGINDVYSNSSNILATNVAKANSFVSDLNTVITSIKSFNANIKIYINLIFNPNDANAWFRVYRDGTSYWKYQFTKNVFNEEIAKINQTNVNIVGTNVILKPSDINDGVHPNSTGYQKIANYLKNVM